MFYECYEEVDDYFTILILIFNEEERQAPLSNDCVRLVLVISYALAQW